MALKPIVIVIALPCHQPHWLQFAVETLFPGFQFTCKLETGMKVQKANCLQVWLCDYGLVIGHLS